MKRAVVYYSLAGNTQAAATAIAEALEADIFPIEPIKALPKSRFLAMMTGGMQATFGLCPPIREMSLSIADYDQILLGTPVWAGKCAAPVKSFFQTYGWDKLDEKLTAVFTCSGGGDNESCIRQLKKRMHHIRSTVALADENNPACADNEARLRSFILLLQ